jgi:hypothetical protein
VPTNPEQHLPDRLEQLSGITRPREATSVTELDCGGNPGALLAAQTMLSTSAGDTNYISQPSRGDADSVIAVRRRVNQARHAMTDTIRHATLRTRARVEQSQQAILRAQALAERYAIKQREALVITSNQPPAGTTAAVSRTDLSRPRHASMRVSTCA